MRSGAGPREQAVRTGAAAGGGGTDVPGRRRVGVRRGGDERARGRPWSLGAVYAPSDENPKLAVDVPCLRFCFLPARLALLGKDSNLMSQTSLNLTKLYEKKY